MSDADPTPEQPTPAAPKDESAASPPSLEERVIAAIKTIYDPEIPVNIYELGLIYKLDVDDEAGTATVEMTLTSPACPVAGSLPGEVEAKIREVEGIEDVALELVWDPPWSKDLLSEAAKLTLGLG